MIGDIVGIGGIFRLLCMILVLFDFVKDIEEVCSDVLFLNYINLMVILMGVMLCYINVKMVGFCYSV